MGVKANLAIQLRADDVVIAESNDSVLWNKVFSAIANDTQDIGGTGKENSEQPDDPPKDNGKPAPAFAAELGVNVDELVGACSPGEQAPYIHLDESYWEKLRSHTGTRGKNAVPPLALAVTLLALWAKHRGAAAMPTAADGQKVLNTIHLTDKNPTRSLNNCDWLQRRNEAWIVNPAKRSHAVKLARAYVLGESPIEAGAK